MVLALYVVAGVMVAGGLLAIYSGSDIIVMERGWTMVISGSVMAASGALLAGIATAVARLQMLEGEFARLSDRLPSPNAPSFTLPEMTVETAPPAERRSSPPPERRSPPPLAAVPEIRERLAESLADHLAEHKDLDIAPEPILAPPSVERPRAEPPPLTAAAEVHDDLFDQPDLVLPEPKGETASGPETKPASQAAEAGPPEADEEPTPATVVGTYNSGGNFYIMYSDGSIEAETPAGKFRFTSLDELKDFIAAGGDRPKAAAPV